MVGRKTSQVKGPKPTGYKSQGTKGGRISSLAKASVAKTSNFNLRKG